MFRRFSKIEEPPESESDVALRESLRLLPAPDVSSDFNARIHAALQQPTPWRQMLWTHARPVLSGAACSLLIMLTLLKALSTAATTPQHLLHPAAAGATLAYRTRERMDELVRSNDLTAASLNGLGALRGPRPLKQRPQHEPPRADAPESRF